MPIGKFSARNITVDGTESSSPLDFYIGVQRGLYEGYSPVGIFGVNTGLSNNSPELLWAQSNIYTFPAAAAVLTISSSSTLDTSAGTGARTLKLFGLDSSYQQVEETITLNGTSNVLTSNSFLRLNKAIVVTAGTSKSNSGNITIKHGASTIAFIPTGIGTTQLALYTVPDNHNLYVFEWGVQVSNGKSTISTLFLEDHVNSVKRNIESIEHTESFIVPITPIIKIPAKNSVFIEGEASTGSHRASGLIHGILVNEALATL